VLAFVIVGCKESTPNSGREKRPVAAPRFFAIAALKRQWRTRVLSLRLRAATSSGAPSRNARRVSTTKDTWESEATQPAVDLSIDAGGMHVLALERHLET